MNDDGGDGGDDGSGDDDGCRRELEGWPVGGEVILGPVCRLICFSSPLFITSFVPASLLLLLLVVVICDVTIVPVGIRGLVIRVPPAFFFINSISSSSSSSSSSYSSSPLSSSWTSSSSSLCPLPRFCCCFNVEYGE